MMYQNFRHKMHGVKRHGQDLKDYRSVIDLLAESGFGWDPDKKMVVALDNVWASFEAHRNSKDALQWQDKSLHILITCLFYMIAIMLKEGVVMVWIIMQIRQNHPHK